MNPNEQSAVTLNIALNADDAAENIALIHRAEQGDAEAQSRLGVRIWDGKYGMKCSYVESVRWLLRAYANGVNNNWRLIHAYERNLISVDDQMHAELCVVVAKIKEEMRAKELKVVSFVAELESRVESGDADAAIMLAKAYLYGDHGISSKYDIASTWFIKAYQLGNVEAEALMNLRRLYADRAAILGRAAREELEQFMIPILQEDRLRDAVGEKGYRGGVIAAIFGFIGTLMAIELSGTVGLIRETSLIWAVGVAISLFVLINRA